MKKRFKKMFATLSLVAILLGTPIVAFASAESGTSPGKGWKKKVAIDGYWYVKNSDGVLGSNYYSYAHDYSKASVKNGNGVWGISSWQKNKEAWAQKPRTTKGTNKAYYDYKDDKK